MTKLNVKNVSYELLTDGQLENLNDWNENVAEALAAREGLHLTEAHWEIIRLMREYYQAYNTSPIRKLLKKKIAETYGPDKATDDYLEELFSKGVMTQATKIAGIPVPKLDAELEQTRHIQSAQKTSNKAHLTDKFEFGGKTVMVHPTGNLVHLDDWNEELAKYMAKQEGITLTDEHWEVIRYLRRFYFLYGIAPMIRLLRDHLREHFGKSKSSRVYLYGLFPNGPAKQGSRIAGLPEPQGCID